MPNIFSISKAQDASSATKRLKKTVDYANTANMATLTGANNEVVMNSETREMRVHNNSTAGGFRFAVAAPYANTTTLPSPAEAYKGHIYVQDSLVANTADVLKVCVEGANNAYVWKTITMS